jgi:ATP-dependent helicase/nuclease subunit B
MGLHTDVEIDNWLQSGGLVLTASDRAARALTAAYHERRRAEGLSAWPAPVILAFASFACTQWEARATDQRMLLNAAQEQTLWATILARESHLATLLEGPRQRLAALAAEAHALLCSHAARYLDAKTRAAWERDAAAFSRWLATFDADCARHSALSAARVPLELIDLLQSDPAPRQPLLVVGFDRLLPVHRALFDVWGAWQELVLDSTPAELRFYYAADEVAELTACAAWCARELGARADTHLLVLTQSLSTRRGALERAFLSVLPASAFEFSLGIPLAHVPLARAAHMLLRWLSGPLPENEIDWLFSTSFAGGGDEILALQHYQCALRSRGLARPSWQLDDFLSQSLHTQPPAAWSRRVIEARRSLAAAQANFQIPLDWSAFALDLLAMLGLPGERLASTEYQTWQRFQSALEIAASLGFDGRRISWSDFLAQFARILVDTLYAPESRSAPIQIAGPSEAAGLTADAIWFLGASEDAWPARGTTNPMIPLYVQRESAMPHATAQLDWQLSESITGRIAASASRITFSFSRHAADAESRPSRLIVQRAGEPQPMPASLAPSTPPTQLTMEFADTSRIPYPHPTVSGGAAVLTAQSQCAFQAFATARLGAQSWNRAEFGLSAQQRGQLLHAVLHSIWAGPPNGLRSLADLNAITDLSAFITTHVQAAMHNALPYGARDRMPARYLELEAERLTGLIREWLLYESTRADFTVEQTESKATAAVAELTLSLRLDRIDRLVDGSRAIIDYKTGNVTAAAWQLPRPEDVQLPLYAVFALTEEPAGVLFAKLRAGESRFVGYARDAQATLLPSLTGRDALVRNPLTDEQLDVWYTAIEQLAHDFLTGRTVTNPRTWPETCARCGLHTLCRIHENRAVLGANEDAEAADV